METRRSGKESMRKTRAAGSAGLILKDGPKFLYNKGSPSPARRLQKIKKLKRHIIKPTDSQPKDKSQDESSHDIAKRRSLPMESKPQTTKGADGQSKSPGIRTRLSTGSIHMNGTMTISTAKERAEQENILKQIEKDVASSAITSTKKRSNSSGTDIPVADPPPPKKRKIGRNDGSGEDNRNDYYCWLCHKEGIVVCCELCPRVYHTKCLELAGELPNDWVCPECEKIMRAECTDTRSKSMEMLTLDQLCSLLMYALERMNHAGSEPFQKPVDTALVPTYSDYIFNPMDLDTLEKNIKKRIYGSTEAFMSDTKWILHNCIIYNGAHHKLTGSAKMIVKICKHEMNEIELCPDCYLNSCIRRNDEWFSELCRTPHTLVWAKLKGYPFWPAKALREEEGQVDVRFFGAHDRSWVPVSQCFLLSKNIPTSLQKGKKNNGLDGAIDELNKHVQKLKEKYGNFEYAPFRTPYDKTDCYKPTSFKLNSPSTSNKPLAPVVIPTRNQPSLLKRAKLSCKTAAAVRNKYNAIVSLKKVEASPEKMAKWLNPGGEIRKLSVENPDNVSDKISSPSRSEIHETIDPSSTSKNKEGNCVASNVKKSFVSMSIVEKVEQKIQGITDTQEEENCEKNDSVVTESVEVSGGTAESEGNGKMSGSVHPDIDNDKTKITDILCKDGPVNDDKTADSAESDNTVSCVTQTAHEINDNNDKDNVVSTEKSNAPISTNIKTNTLLSSLQSKCDNQTGSEGKKDLFQEKLKATIENCKEKVGVTDISDDQGNAEESTDPDTMDTDEEEEPLSLQLDQSPDVREEEMETEDTSSQIFSESSQADESGEGAKLDDTGEVSEDVVQTDDKPVKSGDNNNDNVKSGNDAVVLSSDDSPDKMLTRKTVDLSSKEVIDISDSATEDCGKVEENSGSKNNLDVEQDPIGKELKKNDKEKLGQNAASEQKKQLQDANITERKSDCVAGKSSTENKEISDTRNTNDNGISKKVSQEVNKQSSEEESSGKVFNTSTKSSFPGGNITTEIVKKLPIRTQVAEVNISEDDSDIEKLVIDLDSEKESPSKFSSKGGEVKSVSDFKHGTSPLVSPAFSRSDTKITNKQPTTKIMNSKNNSVKGRNSNDSATTTKIITDNQAGSQKRNGVTDDHVTSQKKVGVNTKLATGGLKTALPKGFTTKKSKSPEKGVPSTGIIMFSDSDSNSSKNKKSSKTESDQEKKNLTIEKVGELPSHTEDVIPHQSRASEEISGKFLKRIMSSVQKNFDEMMEEFQQQTQVPSNEEVLKEAERVKWNCKNELLELKHNFDLTVSEMRASWEAQKEQLTKALSVKHFKDLQAQKQALQKEKDEAVDHAKRRQWCANCQKEAIFYCCWNTSYCDYPCQQAHWPQHAMTCMQTNKRQSTENGDKGESSSAQNQKSVISDTVVGSAGDQNSNPVVPSSSLPKSTSSFRLLPEPIATAIRREEEKRGETRATPNSTFVPIPSPVLQNIHPGQIKLAQPSSNMMPHVPGNVFLNRGMPPRPVSQPTISNSMLVQQPILQQTVYPVQLQRQQTPYNNSMLFPQANPAQQNILGYPRHQF